MQTKPVRKLELKKKTISQLSSKQMNYDGGASWTISYFSVGCATDITRPNTTIIISISGSTR